jgi:L-lysine 6-transaminase
MKPENVIPTLEKHILVDGFHHVVDFEKSEGSWIVDAVTGKKYLDCYSQFASQALGWNHPKLHERMLDTCVPTIAHKMANSDMYSEQFAEFAETFSSITPDFKYHFFIDGGALAVENCLKAAFDWKAQEGGVGSDAGTNYLNVIHLKEAFHGRSGYTMSLTNTGSLKTKWFPKFSWSRVTNPKITFPMDEKQIKLSEELSLMQIKSALQSTIVAAIIVEPIQGEGGDNHFRKEYFQQLREYADKGKCLLIFDEVQTGLGMTGKMWCYEHFGVVPDLMSFGKKTQVCGCCATERMDEVMNHVFKKSGRINSTWGGHITDMVRSTEIIRIIKEDNLVQNASLVGQYFLEKLQGLPLKNVRGKGLMIAFDLKDGDERDKFLSKLSDNMLALKCGNKSIRFRPHLTFSKEDVDQAVEFIQKAL